MLEFHVPASCTCLNSLYSDTEAIEARTLLVSKTLSKRRLPAIRTPAQWTPNSLFFVGNPLNTPGIAGWFPEAPGTPVGSGILYVKG